MKLTLITFIIFLATTTTAQVNQQQKIVDVVEKTKEGKQVFIKGEVTDTQKDNLYTVSDGTASINVRLTQIEDEKTNLIKGDLISVDGTVVIDQKSGKYIETKYFRKHEYVKDPSRCCRPELP